MIVGESVPAGAEECGASPRHQPVGSLEAQDVVDGDGVVRLAFTSVGNVDDHGGADKLLGGDAFHGHAAGDEVSRGIEMGARVLPEERFAREEPIVFHSDTGLEARRGRTRPHGDVFADGASKVDDVLNRDHGSSHGSSKVSLTITCRSRVLTVSVAPSYRKG